MSSRRPSSLAGASAPVMPARAASMNTQALAASTSDASTRPTPGTSSTSSVLPVGSNFPVPAPPGSRNSRCTGAPLPVTPEISRRPIHRGDAVVQGEGCRHQLAGVGVMDDDAGLLTAGLHQGFVHREGAHGRGHIPTVAVVVDASLAHRHLGEGEVDIGLGMGGRTDDAYLRKRRYTATHAVQLARGASGLPMRARKIASHRLRSAGDPVAGRRRHCWCRRA